MKKINNKYMAKALSTFMMLCAMSLAVIGTSTLSSCTSDDDPFFTVTENYEPRILNTEMDDAKIERNNQ